MTPPLLVLFLLAGGVQFACGGQYEGAGGDGGGGSTDGNVGQLADGGSGSLLSGNDARGGPDVPTSVGVACTPLKLTATSGASCEVQASERCSDGTTYDVDCSCLTGRCSCGESAANGGSSGGAPFSCQPGQDCEAYAYAACGFPTTLDAGVGTQAPSGSCPIGLGFCPAGTYAAWFGDGMGNGGGGCAPLPSGCTSDVTCACLAEAGVTSGCPCTESDGSLAVCCP